MLDPTKKDGIRYTFCMYGFSSGQKCILLSEPAPSTSSWYPNSKSTATQAKDVFTNSKIQIISLNLEVAAIH